MKACARSLSRLMPALALGLLLGLCAAPGLAPAQAVHLRERPDEPAQAPARQSSPAATPAPGPAAKPTEKAPAAKPAAKAKAARDKAAKPSRAVDLLSRQSGQAVQAGSQKLSPRDLQAPFSAQQRLMGPPAPPKPKDDDPAAQAAQDNATGGYDPTPKKGPFAKKDPDSPINFRIGRETVVDPITGKEVAKGDTGAVKESIKSGDVKGAMDKLGGKAEVQVDILKF